MASRCASSTPPRLSRAHDPRRRRRRHRGALAPDGAEDWDALGLIAGDPAAQVDRIHLAVDAVLDTVDEAIELGAQLLLVAPPAAAARRHERRRGPLQGRRARVG